MLLIGWLIDYDSYLVAIEMLIGGLLLLVGLYLGSYVGTRRRSVQISCHDTIAVGIAFSFVRCATAVCFAEVSLRYLS